MYITLTDVDIYYFVATQHYFFSFSNSTLILFYSLGKTSRAPDITWIMLCLKPYLPREYSLVRTVKSISVLAGLGLEKRTTNEMFLPWNCNSGQIFLAKTLWTLAGHQLWHESLGQQTKVGSSVDWDCGTSSAWMGEGGPLSQREGSPLAVSHEHPQDGYLAFGLRFVPGPSWEPLHPPAAAESWAWGRRNTMKSLPPWLHSTLRIHLITASNSGVPGALVRTKPPNLRQAGHCASAMLFLSPALSVKPLYPLKRPDPPVKGWSLG